MAHTNGQKVIIVIMVIALIAALFFYLERGPLRMKASYSEDATQRISMENIKLQKSLDKCYENSKRLQREIDSLKDLIPVAKIAVVPAPARRTSEAKPQVITQAKPTENLLVIDVRVTDQRDTPVREVYQPETVMTRAAAPEVRTAFVATSGDRTLPDIFYTNKDEIEFCLRLGGNENRHLPDLASVDGVFAKDNGISGVNWVVVPTKTKVGDWGVTDKGVFYVSKKFVDRYIVKSDKGLVEIKATATRWQAKETTFVKDPDGEFYTYSNNYINY